MRSGLGGEMQYTGVLGGFKGVPRRRAVPCMPVDELKGTLALQLERNLVFLLLA